MTTPATPSSPTAHLPATHWVIRAELEVLSPLHVGTGTDTRIDPNPPDIASTPTSFDGDGDQQDQVQPFWQADIARDHTGNPYIPGASLKGALKALARRLDLDEVCLPLFGEINHGNQVSPAGTQPQRTRAGVAEFRDAQQSHRIPAAREQDTVQTRIAIDRVTGSVVDKKLFQTEVVPAGTRFEVEIILRRADETLAASLVAVLDAIARDTLFSLGAHANLGFGRIGLYGQVRALRFGPDEAQAWFAQAKTDPAAHWTAFAHPIQLPEIAVTQTPLRQQLRLPLSLTFHTPFLVKQPVTKADKQDKQAPDGTPRQQGDRVLLPGASLRGRLRSQAERILRTLGCPVAQGHDVPPVKDCRSPDPATLLFGAAGWRGVLRTAACLGVEPLRPVDHDMLAIDRFTGGGKDGAKFKLRYAECPTLQGSLDVELERLRGAHLDGAHDDVSWIALGLLTLVLRDLDEGDIAFGYGRAKGYGRCRAQDLLNQWRSHLHSSFGPDADTKALAALRSWCAAQATGPIEAQTPLGADTCATPAAFRPAPRTQGFHNPYHFIPFSVQDAEKWLSPDAHRKNGGHSRYQGLSGRLVCRLTTVSPLFIGAAARTPESDQHPKPVDGFTLQNQRAIPATSLRGMISSLFESMSGSNLRVLHPTPYSMRKKMEQALSAVGRIVEHDGELKLYPLTLPTLERDASGDYRIPDRWRILTTRTKGKRPSSQVAPLRAYFGHRGALSSCQQAVYLELPKVTLRQDGTIDRSSEFLRFPSIKDKKTKQKIGDNTTYLIGQRLLRPNAPSLIEGRYQRLPPEEQGRYTRGWVRSLWTSERENELPDTVKHQLFIPDPLETPSADDLLPIPEDVLDTFHALADQALASQHLDKDKAVADPVILPFAPAGRPPRGDKRLTRLQHGDLVCFDLDDDSRVREIAFSSIWRQGIRMPGASRLATTADLIAQVSPHLLPLGMSEKTRGLSPVEQLFGVVEYRPPQPRKGLRKATTEPTAYALAGKVFIGYGRPAPGHTVKLEPPVTLKELSTPKPPSPAFYFRPKNGDGYLSKADLSRRPQESQPAGRKYYLHALRTHRQIAVLDDHGRVPGDASGRLPWQSCFDGEANSGNKRRVRIEPIAADEAFHFEIDFDNLTSTELEQLCATLLPDAHFEHRLGMGKPIGLGSVKLAVERLAIVDRARRYGSDPLDAPRYHRGWCDGNSHRWPTHLKDDSPTAVLDPTPSPETLATRAMSRVDPAVRRALQLLGNPGAVAAPVHYPQVSGRKLECEHYRWFMANDKHKPSASDPKDRPCHLPHLHGNSQYLPSLPRLADTGNSSSGKSRG